MAPVAHDRPDVSPAVTAGLLLAAHARLKQLNLPRPTVAQVLEATGAGRSRAYELKDAILALLPDLVRPVGRPRAPSSPRPSADIAELSQQTVRFIADHPGAMCGGAARRRYSDDFRRFVLELCEQHRELDLAAIAEAVCVPLGTLKDWLRGGRAQTDPPADKDIEAEQVTETRLQMLLEQWSRWQGPFTAFCNHVQYHLRIPYGRTLIASILEQHGVRLARKRPGRSPDEKALRAAFETFFAGAQWEGDGSPIEVQLGNQRFTFNLELMVDAHTDATVGISVRDEEDSAAVTEAFSDGVSTTGDPPLCLLLDNRPSNHTDGVDQCLGESTLRMAATVRRPQNKAHVEGSFGLFCQRVPPLDLSAPSPRALARQVLMLVVTTFFRTLNHRPRRDRAGRSRVELYQADVPTAEQIEQARRALAERCRKQQQARETLAARTDPVVRRTLDDAFRRLGLQDPDSNIRAAIARYPLDAVVAGIATFEGKRAKQTLPPGVDGRYLLGIVRNIAQEDEGIAISEALLSERLAARDRILADLQATRDHVARASPDPLALLKALIDHALQADRRLDRLFWLQTAADHIQSQPQHRPLLRVAARRIHSTHAVPYGQRLAAVRLLAAKVVPLV
jgi:transposase-like protein